MYCIILFRMMHKSLPPHPPGHGGKGQNQRKGTGAGHGGVGGTLDVAVLRRAGVLERRTEQNSTVNRGRLMRQKNFSDEATEKKTKHGCQGSIFRRNTNPFDAVSSRLAMKIIMDWISSVVCQPLEASERLTNKIVRVMSRESHVSDFCETFRSV